MVSYFDIVLYIVFLLSIRSWNFLTFFTCFAMWLVMVFCVKFLGALQTPYSLQDCGIWVEIAFFRWRIVVTRQKPCGYCPRIPIFILNPPWTLSLYDEHLRMYLCLCVSSLFHCSWVICDRSYNSNWETSKSPPMQFLNYVSRDCYHSKYHVSFVGWRAEDRVGDTHARQNLNLK